MSKIVLDTSVVIEYVNKQGELHDLAKLVFSTVNAGKATALIPHPVFAEVFYVASRLYRELQLEKPLERAEKLVKWLYHHPYIQVACGLAVDIEAGKIKHHYKIALTDCYVLAVSKIYNATALFKKREKEMKIIEKDLEKTYRLIFLEDYK